MIQDYGTTLSDSQRICSAGATTASTYTYDLGLRTNNLPGGGTETVNPNKGAGRPLAVDFCMIEIPAGTGATLTTTLQESDDNISFTDIVGVTTGAIAKATLVAGYKFRLYLPAFKTTKRYIQAMYTGNNTFETTGKVSAYIMIDSQTNRSW